MTLWPSAYSTHLGVGRPRFHFLLQEQLLYFYIKELLVLDTLRLSWWGYWAQISHIPGKYQWAKEQSVIEVITAISDRLKKKMACDSLKYQTLSLAVVIEPISRAYGCLLSYCALGTVWKSIRRPGQTHARENSKVSSSVRVMACPTPYPGLI